MNLSFLVLLNTASSSARATYSLGPSAYVPQSSVPPTYAPSTYALPSSSSPLYATSSYPPPSAEPPLDTSSSFPGPDPGTRHTTKTANTKETTPRLTSFHTSHTKTPRSSVHTTLGTPSMIGMNDSAATPASSSKAPRGLSDGSIAAIVIVLTLLLGTVAYVAFHLGKRQSEKQKYPKSAGSDDDDVFYHPVKAWFGRSKARMRSLILSKKQKYLKPAGSDDDDFYRPERVWFGNLKSRMRSIIFESDGTGLHEMEVLPGELEGNAPFFNRQTPVEIGTKSPAEMKQLYTLRNDSWRRLKR